MILEFEEPRLQTLPGLMSPASSLTMSPKAQQFDWRKRKECCAPEDEGKGNKDYRPREGEEAVSGKLSLVQCRELSFFSGVKFIFVEA